MTWWPAAVVWAGAVVAGLAILLVSARRDARASAARRARSEASIAAIRAHMERRRTAESVRVVPRPPNPERCDLTLAEHLEFARIAARYAAEQAHPSNQTED